MDRITWDNNIGTKNNADFEIFSRLQCKDSSPGWRCHKIFLVFKHSTDGDTTGYFVSFQPIQVECYLYSAELAVGGDQNWPCS